jgi:hypothetical protein
LARVPADVRRVLAVVRRVVLRRFAGLRGVVVVVVSAIAGISPFGFGPVRKLVLSVDELAYPSNTCL